MLEYKCKDTLDHPLMYYDVATLRKHIHRLLCSYPGITGLALFPASIQNLDEDTFISQFNFLSPSQFVFVFVVCVSRILIWGK
jgi:hypothetical protein